jgi:hypothetical protein
MNDMVFDLVTNILAGNGSRRLLVKSLTKLALTATLAWPEFEAAAACKKVGQLCHRNGDCCAGAACMRGKCRCKESLASCGGNCVDVKTDERRCGQCGRACGGPIAWLCCDGQCANPTVSHTHCGGLRPDLRQP